MTIWIEQKNCADLPSTRRMLYYAYYISLAQGKPFSDTWIKFASKIDQKETAADRLIDYIVSMDEKIENADEEIVQSLVADTEGDQEQDDDNRAIAGFVWKCAKEIIVYGGHFKEALFDYLNGVAQKHPYIAKGIVSILTGILAGLISNCIYDGISSGFSNEKQGTAYIQFDELNKGETIFIKSDEHYVAVRQENGHIQITGIQNEEVKTIEEGP